MFYGFLPKTLNELEKVIKVLSQNKFSQVFFVPSNKINFYLSCFKKYFLGRKILIAREITKVHETFLRGEIDKLKLFKSSLLLHPYEIIYRLKIIVPCCELKYQSEIIMKRVEK